MTAPVIPDSAPFSPDQRAWLNGFFAGLFSAGTNGNGHAIATNNGTASAVVAVPPVAEEFPWHDPALPLADRLALADGKPVERQMMAAMAQLDCGACGYLCQTYSEAIARGDERDLTRCTPGGSDTAKALKKIVAARSAEGTTSSSGQNGHAAPPSQSTSLPDARVPSTTAAPAAASPPLAVGVRDNPFPAKLVECVRLTHMDAAKDTRHVVIDLLDSGLTYEPGDSLGVIPENCSELVNAVLGELSATGGEIISVGDRRPRSLRDWLRSEVALNSLRSLTLECLASAAVDPAEADALVALAQDDSSEFIDSSDVLDALHRFPSARPPLEEFLASLGRLQPRLYSISSSLRAHPRQVHLTVGVVRFQSAGRWRNGTASHFLGMRAISATQFRCSFKNRLVFDYRRIPDRPIIMVGPGTGIAPFRAFLQEREAIGAKGRSWLFFGNQFFHLDFLYRSELDGFLDRGALTRLDIAFSRDSAEKVYVQDRMLEHAAELWHWLEEGAYFYVCGDAKRMARDVDQMLCRIVAEQGRRSAEEAKNYISELGKTNRYHRDVY